MKKAKQISQIDFINKIFGGYELTQPINDMINEMIIRDLTLLNMDINFDDLENEGFIVDKK